MCEVFGFEYRSTGYRGSEIWFVVDSELWRPVTNFDVAAAAAIKEGIATVYPSTETRDLHHRSAIMRLPQIQMIVRW